jgi:hypothetical protein
LGSKSQRGLTQLTLDTLFQHTAPYLASLEYSSSAFPSLCVSDVSEAQLMLAPNFFESVYDDSNGRPSRAPTPGLVRDSTLPNFPDLPGAFPTYNDPVYSTPAPKSVMKVFDRLYPSLSGYQLQHAGTSHTNSKHVLASPSRLKYLTRSIAKLTSPFQESSFLSVGPSSSRRQVPRVSALPQSPAIDDIAIAIDDTAEYAIIVSMYEVYNDRIYDLLTAAATLGKMPQKRRALVFKNTENSPDRKVVAGLRKVVCVSLDEALLVLETGLLERKVAGTGSNAVSSRSHGFFSFEVKKRHRAPVPGPWSGSTMTIVDLAGKPRLYQLRLVNRTVTNLLLQALNELAPPKPLVQLWQKQVKSTNHLCTLASACRCKPTTPTPAPHPLYHSDNANSPSSCSATPSRTGLHTATTRTASLKSLSWWSPPTLLATSMRPVRS